MLSRFAEFQKIGAGGMAVVYRAEDTMLHRPVALKFPTQDSCSSEEARARFLREARTAAALNHPNICTIHEVGEVLPGEEEILGSRSRIAPGTPFIAMELIEGHTLEEVLRSSGPLAIQEFLRIAVRISEGLSAAHATDVVHRDLKPSNVMVTDDNRIKILDFGLAKTVESRRPDLRASEETISEELTRESRILGTVAYMSPEQAMGKTIDSRSDVFSFGIMLYEMATGHRPFHGDSSTSTLAKILEVEPEPLGELRPDLPPDLLRIVRRCLSKKPDDRYNDTRDLVASLKDLRQETTSGTARVMQPSAARSASVPATVSVSAAPKRSRARRVLPWVIAATIALVLALPLARLVMRSSPEPAALPRPEHRQITFEGWVAEPSLSPDGSSMAYVEWGEQGKQIVVRDLAGGQPVVVFQADQVGDVQWSPDGTELVIVGRKETDSEQRGAYRIPRLGGASRFYEGLYMKGVWSPDGDRLAMVHMAHALIWIIDKGTGRRTELELDGNIMWLRELDWGPNDRFVLVSSDEEGRYAVWTAAEDGGDLRVAFNADTRISSPRWGAGGEAVYFLVGRGETSELIRMSFDARAGRLVGEPVPILTGLRAKEVCLSRDGNRLLYLMESRHSNLWRVDLDPKSSEAAEPVALSHGTQYHDVPRISPDGTRVTFTRGRSSARGVFVMPLDGSDPVPLTFFDGPCWSPVWSPDGTWIAFGADAGDAPRVWKVSASGGDPIPFGKTKTSIGLAWAPGSQIIYQRPGNRNFHMLDPLTEEETPLIQDDSIGWAFRPCPSPDGTAVAVHWNRLGTAEDGVWVISLEDSSETFLQHGIATPIGWSADSNHVYTGDGAGSIWRVARHGGTPDPVLSLSLNGVVDAHIAPDGSRLVVAVAESQSDLWLAEGLRAAVDNAGRP